MAVAADLVDAPIDFEPVVVRVAELDRELAAGAPAALEIDRDPVPAQMVARPHDIVEAADLEGDVVQLDILGRRRGRADEGDAVMVAVAAQKHHAARHHLLGIHVGDQEAQHLGVEPGRALDLLHIEHDMPDLADTERQPLRPLHLPDPVGVVVAHPYSPRALRTGEKAQPAKKPSRRKSLAGFGHSPIKPGPRQSAAGGSRCRACPTPPISKP